MFPHLKDLSSVKRALLLWHIDERIEEVAEPAPFTMNIANRIFRSRGLDMEITTMGLRAMEHHSLGSGGIATSIGLAGNEPIGFKRLCEYLQNVKPLVQAKPDASLTTKQYFQRFEDMALKFMAALTSEGLTELRDLHGDFTAGDGADLSPAMAEAIMKTHPTALAIRATPHLNMLMGWSRAKVA